MSKAEDLQKELLYNQENGYKGLNEKDKKDIFAFSEDYKAFLNACKTERECVDFTLEQAEKASTSAYLGTADIVWFFTLPSILRMVMLSTFRITSPGPS